jgi:hypothetical protein
MWLLAEALGQAFWWSMVARMAGETPQPASGPKEHWRTPADAWDQSFWIGADELEAYSEMTDGWQPSSRWPGGSGRNGPRHGRRGDPRVL